MVRELRGRAYRMYWRSMGSCARRCREGSRLTGKIRTRIVFLVRISMESVLLDLPVRHIVLPHACVWIVALLGLHGARVTLQVGYCAAQTAQWSNI